MSQPATRQRPARLRLHFDRSDLIFAAWLAVLIAAAALVSDTCRRVPEAPVSFSSGEAGAGVPR